MEIPHPTNSSQPQASNEMKITNDAQGSTDGTNFVVKNQGHHDIEFQNPKVDRLRGGGAGKDCFLFLVGCFLCFGFNECCEVCCGCVADCICCPCEMCC